MNNRLFHILQSRHEFRDGNAVQACTQPCCEREKAYWQTP